MKAITFVNYFVDLSAYLLTSSSFPIWEVTVPACIVLIFAIASLTAIFMVKGRYIFDFVATHKGVRIKTEIDQTE